MKREEWFLELIERYFQGAIDRKTVSQAIAKELPPRRLHAHEAGLVRSCEWALRHMTGATGCVSNRELRYHWRCLRQEIRFDPRERNRVRYYPPIPVKVPVARGIVATVYDYSGLWGIMLNTAKPALLSRLETFECEPAWRNALQWFQVKTTVIGARRHYLVRRDRARKLLRELSLLAETHFSAAGE